MRLGGVFGVLRRKWTRLAHGWLDASLKGVWRSGRWLSEHVEVDGWFCPVLWSPLLGCTQEYWGRTSTYVAFSYAC